MGKAVYLHGRVRLRLSSLSKRASYSQRADHRLNRLPRQHLRCRATSSLDFPTTAGTFQPAPFVPAWNNSSPAGFAAKLNPSGSILIWSTYVMSADGGPQSWRRRNGGDRFRRCLSRWPKWRGFPCDYFRAANVLWLRDLSPIQKSEHRLQLLPGTPMTSRGSRGHARLWWWIRIVPVAAELLLPRPAPEEVPKVSRRPAAGPTRRLLPPHARSAPRTNGNTRFWAI